MAWIMSTNAHIVNRKMLRENVIQLLCNFNVDLDECEWHSGWRSQWIYVFRVNRIAYKRYFIIAPLHRTHAATRAYPFIHISATVAHIHTHGANTCVAYGEYCGRTYYYRILPCTPQLHMDRGKTYTAIAHTTTYSCRQLSTTQHSATFFWWKRTNGEKEKINKVPNCWMEESVNILCCVCHAAKSCSCACASWHQYTRATDWTFVWMTTTSA